MRAILAAWAIWWLLSSCSTWNQQAQDIQIIYAEGGCLLIVEGLSVEQVAEKRKEWDFDTDCRISVRTVID